MAQPASNPKIEELRGRLKADPKSRLFFPLAEELRKVDQFSEAEQVLRTGLASHPTYLSAWVSLGRVLREGNKNAEAVEALNKALQLDAGNAVAAKLLAEAHYALGDKVEAIKKYKLVRALVPPDEELDGVIDRLEDELNPVTLFNPPGEDTLRRTTSGSTPEPLDESPFVTDESPAEQAPAVTREQQIAPATGEEEPIHTATIESPFEEPALTSAMAATSSESPFEEPAPVPAISAIPSEKPGPISVQQAPNPADVPWSEEEPASDVFAPSESGAQRPAADDVANTVTMADLYVEQGLPDKAREIYLGILERNPENREVRLKLDALADAGQRNLKAVKLERWLAKVKKRREGSVV